MLLGTKLDSCFIRLVIKLQVILLLFIIKFGLFFRFVLFLFDHHARYLEDLYKITYSHVYLQFGLLLGLFRPYFARLGLSYIFQGVL